MTLKRIIWIPLAFIIAWYWSDELTAAITFIPIAEIAALLTPDNLLNQTPTFYLLVAIWMAIIWLIFANINLPFGFVASKPRQYGTSKSIRRLQGVTAELTIIAIIYLLLLVVLTAGFSENLLPTEEIKKVAEATAPPQTTPPKTGLLAPTGTGLLKWQTAPQKQQTTPQLTLVQMTTLSNLEEKLADERRGFDENLLNEDKIFPSEVYNAVSTYLSNLEHIGADKPLNLKRADLAKGSELVGTKISDLARAVDKVVAKNKKELDLGDLAKIAKIRMLEEAKPYGVERPQDLTPAILEGRYVPFFRDLKILAWPYRDKYRKFPGFNQDFGNIDREHATYYFNTFSPLDHIRVSYDLGKKIGEIRSFNNKKAAINYLINVKSMTESEASAFIEKGLRENQFPSENSIWHLNTFRFRMGYDEYIDRMRQSGATEKQVEAFKSKIKHYIENISVFEVFSIHKTDSYHPLNLRGLYEQKRRTSKYTEDRKRQLEANHRMQVMRMKQQFAYANAKLAFDRAKIAPPPTESIFTRTPEAPKKEPEPPEVIDERSDASKFFQKMGAISDAHFYKILFASFWLYLILAPYLKGPLAKQYESLIRFLDQGRFGLGGSGRFAGLLEEWANIHGDKSLFMGRSLYNPFLNIGLKDDMHMLTVAGSRAGKGTTAIIPNLLQWQGSAIVIDPKGTNAAVTARYRREMGQKVYIIDPFGVVQGEKCSSFNPLDGMDPDSPMIREQLSSIAEALVVPDPNVKDTHWDDGARTILTGFLAQLICTHEKPTLPMLRGMLALSDDDSAELYADMSFNESAGSAAKEAANRIIRGIGTNEILGLLSNADKHTEWLSSPVMHKAIEGASFQFSELKDEPTTVFLVLPPEQLKKHNRFLRLFVNMVISQMPVGGRARVPVLMIMDEFLALGRMTEIEEAFAVMASYNLILWPFVQDLGRLTDLYGKSINAFITNSRAVQVFGVTDKTTTEFVSDNLGKRMLTAPKLIESSRQTVPLRTPDEVAKDISRKGGRQYILRSGEAPLVIEKVPYYDGSPVRWFSKNYSGPQPRFLKGLFAGKYDSDPDFK